MISKFVVVAICVSFTVAGNHMKRFKEESDKCMKSMDIQEAEVDDLLKKRPLVIGEGKMRCYFQCLLQGLGDMDADGNITDKFDPNEFPADFIKHAEECRMNLPGDDNCEKAFNFHKCIIDKKEGN